MDNLCAFLRTHGDPSRDRVLVMLITEDYDSESVEIDLKLKIGNLQVLRADLRCFLRDYQIDTRAFSTGVAFQYHKWYASKENADAFQNRQRRDNKHDFGGHALSALFVPARFESIKSEIRNSKFDEFVIDKAKKYIDTSDCKAMQCREYSDPLHFCINDGDSLRVEHLHALFLYTDFSALCTQFSSSFRAVYLGESLNSVKARNGRYHHFAKSLKELVMYFGITTRGPFYCGMSIILHIPQFVIRMNGPTSTSLHIEVAMRFGGVEGMIIQLNDIFQDERHFDCAWLSAFPEESEHLFMGGRNPLRLETVRVVETNNNYRRFIGAFWVFDMLLSGTTAGPNKASVRILRCAINDYLGIKSNRYPPFVNDTFRHFCARKTHITLNLHDMEFALRNEEFVSLVMNRVYVTDMILSEPVGDGNLFKPVLFELFGNVQEITLIAQSVGSHGNAHAFSLRRLMQFTFPESLTKINIYGWGWMSKSIYDSVRQTFTDQGWNHEMDSRGYLLTLDR